MFFYIISWINLFRFVSIKFQILLRKYNSPTPSLECLFPHYFTKYWLSDKGSFQRNPLTQMSLCWNPQMRNTTALRGVHGTDRLRSERVWLTEVSACELSQDSERARLGGAGAWLPILRILDQSLLTAIIGDEAGHVFHPQTMPGDRSPLWPLSFTTTAQHTTKKKESANGFT